MDDSGWDPKWGPSPPPPEQGGFVVPSGLDTHRRAPEVRGEGRPPLVDAFAFAMIASTVSGVFIAPARAQLALGCVVVLSVALVYFFWVGRGWARVLVMLGSIPFAAGILVLFAPAFVTHQLSEPQRVKIVADAGLAVAMLIGLNTARVRRYFEAKPAPR